ncbi:MAG: threonylcarbamoyl-AMP synthase [Clostridiales bacterium]|jgi:L-threonylcarbamoyladenylate synthase|nr:threonylcarbamoyl-AMP synthase [Clostridiales bacterium]
METRVKPYNKESIAEGAEIIRRGGVVAFRTETVYGLGANAYDAAAVRQIFRAKGRPSDNPLIVHLPSVGGIETVAREVPDYAGILIDRFMPGPLSLVLKKRPLIPDAVTAGLDTVAVRVPADAAAREFIAAAGVPVAAPSANLSGRPSPTAAAHVLADMNGKIPLILGEELAVVGLESTVLDCTVYPPQILREGGITREQIEAALGITLSGAEKNSDKPRAPGMKYKHYAPNIPLYYAANGRETALIDKLEEIGADGGAAVIVLTRAAAELFCELDCDVLIAGEGLKESARNLYSVLRSAEKIFENLLVLGAPDDGIGRAINNRLEKACGGNLL